MHHPKLYSWVHKKHHEWPAPIAITFVYSTRIEFALNMIPVVLVNFHFYSNCIFYDFIRQFKFLFCFQITGSAHDESSFIHSVGVVCICTPEGLEEPQRISHPRADQFGGAQLSPHDEQCLFQSVSFPGRDPRNG